MAPFDRPYTTCYWSAIVNIALSGTVSVLFNVEWYRDLEIWASDHSRSSKLIPFESLGAVTYSPSIVAIPLSCISSDIKPDVGRKSWFFFHTPLHSTPLLGKFSSEYWHPVWCGKTRMVGLPDGGKHFEDIYNRLIVQYRRVTDRQTDRHADRRTDGQTFCHGIVRAMHTRRALKTFRRFTPRRDPFHTSSARLCIEVDEVLRSSPVCLRVCGYVCDNSRTWSWMTAILVW